MALIEVVAHLRANADNMVAGFRRAQGAATSFGQTVNHTSGVAQRGFSAMGRYAMLGATAMQGAAVAGATMGVKFAMANEQAIISFKTLLGSQQDAEQMFRDLQQFAAKTPFEFPQLRDAASRLLTTGIEAERLIPLLTAIGDSTAAMGTGAEGIQRGVYALQQMNLIGKITGQDMMQLANAGIPAWDALASAAGMSVQQVKKAVERGDLQNSVQLLMKGIEMYSGAAMGRVKGMMGEQSTTLMGLMSTLKDNVNIALGDMMKPATSAIKEALPFINDAVGKTFKGMTEPVNALVTRIMEAFTKLIPAIGPTMIGLSQILVTALEGITPVVVAVAGVLPSLLPVLDEVSVAIKALGEAIGPLISEILVAMIPIFAEVVKAVTDAVVFILEMDGAVKVLTISAGALIAAMVAYKATTKVMRFLSMAKDIAILIARKLGLTVATNLQTSAERRLAAAQALQASSAMGAAAAQTALNTSMALSPIGLVIAAVAALVVAFVVMWKKFEWFRMGFATGWNVIVDIVQKAINAIVGILNFVANQFIDLVNIMIRVWNKIPFTKKIGEISGVNLQLDIMAAKIEKANLKTKDSVDMAKDLYSLYTNLQVKAKFDKMGIAAPKKKKDPKIPTGPDEKTLQAMKKLRGQITKTYENGIKNAQEALKSLKEKHREFNKQLVASLTDSVNLQGALEIVAVSTSQVGTSVKDAIVEMLKFGDVISAQEAATAALTQAQGKQREIQKEVAAAEEALGKLQAKYSKTRSGKERIAMMDDIRNATENLQAAQEKLAESNKAVADAQKEADSAGDSFLAGLRKQVDGARKFAEQIRDLRKLNLNEAALSQILSAGGETGGKIAAELISGGADAIRRANEMTKELNDLATETGAEVGRSFMAAGKSMADSLLDAMQAEASKASKFAEKVKTLVTMGLSKDNLENVIKAGYVAGGQIADALIEGGAPAVEKANEIKSALDKVATTAAELAGKAFYSAGETLAQKLVDGLQEKFNKIKPTLEGVSLPNLEKLATGATTVVQKTVEQIKAIQPSEQVNLPKSPEGKSREEWRKIFLEMVNKQFNKKFKTVNEYISAGTNAASRAARRTRWEDYVKANNVPDMARGGVVSATPGGRLVRIGEAGHDEAVIPLSSAILSKMGGGGTTIHVTVQAGMGADGAEIGKQLVRVLQDYERKNGKIPVRARR